jgi:aminopeptidase N
MSKVTVKDFMDNWLLQMNYPKVNVAIDNTSGKTKVNFMQERFLLSVENNDTVRAVSPYG